MRLVSVCGLRLYSYSSSLVLTPLLTEKHLLLDTVQHHITTSTAPSGRATPKLTHLRAKCSPAHQTSRSSHTTTKLSFRPQQQSERLIHDNLAPHRSPDLNPLSLHLRIRPPNLLHETAAILRGPSLRQPQLTASPLTPIHLFLILGPLLRLRQPRARPAIHVPSAGNRPNTTAPHDG